MKEYPSLNRFSKFINIPTEDLVEAYEIERNFHYEILQEKSKVERIKLYKDVYTRVHDIYQRKAKETGNGIQLKSRRARLFEKEISGKSVLEVGCGQGAFLITVAKYGTATGLCGLDVTIPCSETKKKYNEIEFISADITEFDFDKKFDVVYSNHVFEHIAPADVHTHISSIKNALNKNGTLIINAPNKLFGPSDVTRIIDFSYTNKIGAQGTHLNETTYNDLIELLKKYGFVNFRTTLPGLVIRNVLPDFRMSTSALCKIENNNNFIEMLHKIKFRGRCLFAYEVTVICDMS